MAKVHQDKFIHSISNYDSSAKYINRQISFNITLWETPFKNFQSRYSHYH